jgi:hypothetical protein
MGRASDVLKKLNEIDSSGLIDLVRRASKHEITKDARMWPRLKSLFQKFDFGDSDDEKDVLSFLADKADDTKFVTELKSLLSRS